MPPPHLLQEKNVLLVVPWQRLPHPQRVEREKRSRGVQMLRTRARETFDPSIHIFSLSPCASWQGEPLQHHHTASDRKEAYVQLQAFKRPPHLLSQHPTHVRTALPDISRLRNTTSLHYLRPRYTAARWDVPERERGGAHAKDVVSWSSAHAPLPDTGRFCPCACGGFVGAWAVPSFHDVRPALSRRPLPLREGRERATATDGERERERGKAA
jgi:hypothetical protein